MTISGERLDAVVAEAVAGNRDALREVLEIIRPIVVRYCRARVGTTERSGLSADDVAQEVCLAAITALPRYKDQGRPFLAFVYGIAAHKVADAHRAAARNRADPTDVVPERYSLEAGPEQMAIDSESSARMNKLLAVLPEKQREILILRVVVGMSAEETAEAVGSTAGAVRVAQHRALARLKAEISGDGARPCLISDAGPPTGAIRRSTRSTARTDSSTRWHRSSRCTRPTPARPNSHSCWPGWRDEIRTPPADGTGNTARRGGGADARGRGAQAHPHVDGCGGFGRRGRVVPRRFRRGGGRRRSRRPALWLAHDAVRRAAADAHRSGGARLAAVGRGAAADRRGPVGRRAGQAADADDHRRDCQ